MLMAGGGFVVDGSWPGPLEPQELLAGPRSGTPGAPRAQLTLNFRDFSHETARIAPLFSPDATMTARESTFNEHLSKCFTVVFS